MNGTKSSDCLGQHVALAVDEGDFLEVLELISLRLAGLHRVHAHVPLEIAVDAGVDVLAFRHSDLDEVVDASDHLRNECRVHLLAIVHWRI